MSAGEFVGGMGKNIEGINFLDIRSYLENSKVPATDMTWISLTLFEVARKIASYSDDSEFHCSNRVSSIPIVHRNQERSYTSFAHR